MNLKMRNEDGTTTEVQYKPTSQVKQGQAVSAYLVSRGQRPSEAAMQVASYKPAKLRSLYQSLVLLGEVKQ